MFKLKELMHRDVRLLLEVGRVIPSLREEEIFP